MTAFEHGIKKIFFSVILIACFVSISFASQVEVEEKVVEWQILDSHSDGFSAQISLNASNRLGSKNSIFDLSEDGLGFVSTSLVAVPNGKGLRVDVSDSDINRAEITVGEPFIFRGIRLFPLQFKPTESMLSGSNTSSEDFTFDVSFVGTDPRANNYVSPQNFTAEGLKFLRTHVMNLDEIDINVVTPVGRILIMVQNNATTIENLQPYVQWKTQQGYKVFVDNSATPGNANSIKSVINTHYNSDDPIPLEYILMVGDHDGSIFMVGDMDEEWGSASDYPYTLFDDEDSPVGTVAIGRFSVESQGQLQIAVRKTILYERDVFMDDTSWLENVVLASGSGSGISPIQVNRRVRKLFADHNITADTLWYTMPGGDSSIPSFIVNKVNEGAHFVNYRGYLGMSQWQNSNCNNFTNRFTLPVVVTITCDTGTWGSNWPGGVAFTEGFLRAGTINNPKGGVACIGTATAATHTPYNNVVSVGIFDAILRNNVRSLGWALVSAKYRLWEAYTGYGRNEDIRHFSEWNNLMGDPALRMWVGVPQIPTVEHEETVYDGDTSLDVTVTLPGEWPELVWATIATDETVIDSRVVPNSGDVRLYFDNLPQDENVYLTVCGDNVVPQIDTLQTASTEVLLVTTDVVIDDGDAGDNIANPGETISLDITVTNSGTEELSGATASIVSDDPSVNLTIANSFDVPTLASGASSTIQNVVTFEVNGYAHDGYLPELTLLLNGTQRSAIRLTINSWIATSDSQDPIVDENGDDALDPGETVNISFQILNIGSKAASGLTANLTSSNSGISVNNDQRSFIDMDVDGASNNETDPFSISASNTLRIGQKVDFTLQLTDGRGAKDSTNYSIYLGNPLANDLTGPGGEYWAIDEYDISYSPQVDYNWIDIESDENDCGIVDSQNNDDESVVKDLQFTFNYYGHSYTQITICSNGWAAFGSQEDNNWERNWPIPNPLGPEAMLAPFWDNLIVSGLGNVYAFFDSDTHQYIITWDCKTAGNPWEPDSGEDVKFQIVLLDSEYYPTATGNGMILFQYDEIYYDQGSWGDNTFATIGIESPDSREGVLYEYWNDREDGATEIGNQTGDIKTIVFTDDLTANFTLEVDDIDNSGNVIPTEFAISDVYPNPFNPSTTISISLPISGQLSVKIFNLLGQEVALLASDHFNVGVKQFSFNADKMASGIYFVKASLPGKSTQIKKVMLVR
jgi:Peptidase family C25/Secretion system C-terminal sorting domain